MLFRSTIIDNTEEWQFVDITFETASESVSVDTQIPTPIAIQDTTSEFNLSAISFESASDSMYIEMHTEVFRRITEDGSIRVTEDGDVRYTEGD